MHDVHKGVDIMKWDKDLRWDGVSHKEEITEALMSYIKDEEKHLALTTSYGDLGVLLKKNHTNHGSGNDECDISGMLQGVEIELHRDKFRTQLTWNKAAKLISEWARCKQA